MKTASAVLSIEEYSGLSAQDRINTFLQSAIRNQCAAACWSCPETTDWDMIMDPRPDLIPHTSSRLLHEMESGYIIAPFHTQSDSTRYFIHSRVHLHIGANSTWKIQSGYDYLKKQVEEEKAEGSVTRLLKTDVIREASKFTCYTDLVQKAKEAIGAEQFQKVVLARSKDVAHHSPSIESILMDLRATYPHAFISVFYHPETGLWITASPELLLSTDSKGIFRTTALAGTQKYRPEVSLRDVLWTHKEIEEQALVCRYIINCFKTIRVREYDEQGPKTIRSGNLLHLKTDFSIDTNEVNMPELGSTMLTLIHPTSAVCGMPKLPALDFIKTQETFDRELFTGYSGPVNMGGNTALFVSLRCGKVYSNKITLFAGAGITSDSVPEKEWEETELKMDVIGRAFSILPS